MPLLNATLRAQLHRYQLELMHAYGENFQIKFPLPWNHIVVLNDPYAIKEVIEDANPPKAPEFVRGLEATAEVPSLLTAEWDDWLIQRRMVRRCKLTQLDPVLKALGFNSFKVQCFQTTGFKYQLAPLQHGGAGDVGETRRLLAGRCKLDPGLKAPGFKGST